MRITISTVVSASKEAVWEAWTNPVRIVKWNFAADDWCCPWAKNELEVGKRFSFRMEAKDGSMGFDFGGTYTKVIAQQEVSYIMDDQRKATTLFKNTNQGVKIETSFEPETENDLDMQEEGWQTILNNFKKYVENKDL